ncbi:MAG: hypothetical protein K9M10_01095 [Candidatus Pacebacteria bacterium]|nr:hypothetical protein [Candidatus Paceibacterota bacterium]MCF7857059.1 hypothetical protein [Candidatus Paceibacterota bacterium]
MNNSNSLSNDTTRRLDRDIETIQRSLVDIQRDIEELKRGVSDKEWKEREIDSEKTAAERKLKEAQQVFTDSERRHKDFKETIRLQMRGLEDTIRKQTELTHRLSDYQKKRDAETSYLIRQSSGGRH